MKKICLLAIGSFFSVLAFSQNAATAQTVPGQPKAGRGNTPQASTNGNTFMTATQTTAVATPAQPAIKATAKRTATRKTTAKAKL